MTEAELAELTGRLQVALARLVRLLRRQTPTAVGQSSLSTLATLAAEGPLRAGDLALREGVRPPTMTRIVTALEESGYVARTADPADGRAWLVALTPTGEELVVGTKSARAGLLRTQLAALTPQQRAAIAAALPALEELGDESKLDSRVE